MSNFTKKKTIINGLTIINMKVYKDNRGYFMETWQKEAFVQLGINVVFVQDNHSKSKRGVLRGIHFQEKHKQAKLIRCVRGKIMDIAVDLREESKTFGQHFKLILTETNNKCLFIPEGFGHGFLSLEDDSELFYKTTNYYCTKFENGILYSDPELQIDWQGKAFGIDEMVLSEKDKKLPTLKKWLKSRKNKGL